MVEKVPLKGSRRYNKITKTLFLQIFGHAAFIKQIVRIFFCLIKAALPKICKKSVFVILLCLMFSFFEAVKSYRSMYRFTLFQTWYPTIKSTVRTKFISAYVYSCFIDNGKDKINMPEYMGIYIIKQYDLRFTLYSVMQIQ